jgi:hypothetical protein
MLVHPTWIRDANSQRETYKQKMYYLFTITEMRIVKN